GVTRTASFPPPRPVAEPILNCTVYFAVATHPNVHLRGRARGGARPMPRHRAHPAHPPAQHAALTILNRAVYFEAAAESPPTRRGPDLNANNETQGTETQGKTRETPASLARPPTLRGETQPDRPRRPHALPPRRLRPLQHRHD